MSADRDRDRYVQTTIREFLYDVEVDAERLYRRWGTIPHRQWNAILSMCLNAVFARPVRRRALIRLAAIAIVAAADEAYDD